MLSPGYTICLKHKLVNFLVFGELVILKLWLTLHFHIVGCSIHGRSWVCNMQLTYHTLMASIMFCIVYIYVGI